MTAKERHYRLLVRRGFPEQHARRLATGLFIGIGLVTDSTFMANRDDGFGKDERSRKVAYANARRLGIDTAGKSWFPGLARKGKGLGRDPDAWVGQKEGRGHIKKVCEKRNWNCEGSVNHKMRLDGPGPGDKPYTPAEDIVQRKVDDIVEKEHEGHITPKKRKELTEKTRTTLAGNQ